MSLLLLLLAIDPLGQLPDSLKIESDPAGAWVGRVGVGLSASELWLSGEELPRWQSASSSGFDPGLLRLLEKHTKAGRAAAGALRFVGEIYLELSPQVSFSDVLVVLRSAQRGGFGEVRMALQGQPPMASLSTSVGAKPGGRDVVRLFAGHLVEAPECSVDGQRVERLIAIEPSSKAQEWMPVLAEQSGFRLAALGTRICRSE